MTASELNNLVLEALERSANALNASQIGKALPNPYRKSEARIAETLENLRAEGKVWQWGVIRKKAVYSSVTPDERARQCMIEAHRAPLSAAKLKEAAGRRLTAIRERKRLSF